MDFSKFFLVYEDFINRKGFKHWIWGFFHSPNKVLGFFGFFFRILREFFWVNNPSIFGLLWHGVRQVCRVRILRPIWMWGRIRPDFQRTSWWSIDRRRLQCRRPAQTLRPFYAAKSPSLWVAFQVNSTAKCAQIKLESLKPQLWNARHLINDENSTYRLQVSRRTKCRRMVLRSTFWANCSRTLYQIRLQTTDVGQSCSTAIEWCAFRWNVRWLDGERSLQSGQTYRKRPELVRSSLEIPTWIVRRIRQPCRFGDCWNVQFDFGCTCQKAAPFLYRASSVVKRFHGVQFATRRLCRRMVIVDDVSTTRNELSIYHLCSMLMRATFGENWNGSECWEGGAWLNRERASAVCSIFRTQFVKLWCNVTMIHGVAWCYSRSRWLIWNLKLIYQSVRQMWSDFSAPTLSFIICHVWC